MKKTLVIVLLSIIALSNCKKETVTVTPDPGRQSTEYFPFTKGSYWVYISFRYDKAGKLLSSVGVQDSAYIAGDSVVGGKLYHTMVDVVNPGPIITRLFFRDSSNCIVNNKGTVLFCANAAIKSKRTPDIYSFGNYWAYQDTTLSIPAGSFTCVDFRGEIFLKSEQFEIPHLSHYYFSKGIGRVKSNEYVSTSTMEEVRTHLLRYNIK